MSSSLTTIATNSETSLFIQKIGTLILLQENTD